MHRQFLGVIRMLLSVSLAMQMLLPMGASTSYASSVTSAAFSGGSGTVSVGGTLYAKNGAALTLTVSTSSDTECVDITGAFTGHQQSSTAKSTWIFSFTGTTGDGVRTVSAMATPKFNGQGVCTGTAGTGTASFILDNTGPTVSGALTPAPNAAGWNNSNVAIIWSASDSASGVGSGPTPANDSVSSDTAAAGITKSATAADRLGNSGSGSVTVKLDKTAPTVTGAASPGPNANGWNNTNVTVSFTCSDALSGIKTCTSATTTLSNDGANQSVTGLATDKADNTGSSTVTVNIDKTAPSLSGTATTSPNANGWYTSNVSIHWTCGDALSGINGSCPIDSTISGEGSGMFATASVSDKASNSTTANGSTVNIDKTAPVTTASVPSGWSATNATVTLTPTDALSGVASTFYILDGGAQQQGTSVGVTTDGSHTLQFWSMDKAGNAEVPHTVQVLVDKTAPTITHSLSPAANANGWNNANVTVSFSCADGTSGIASCTAPQTVTSETAATGQVVTGTAVDNAGNTGNDSVTVRLDKTPPTLSGAPTSSPNGSGWYNTNVTIAWTCADALSGISGSCPGNSTISSEGTGLTASASVSDNAGSTTSATSSPAVKIDKTAPLTTATAPANWNNSNVTVSLVATDSLSGVATTNYVLDGGAPQNGTSVPISAEGVHTLEFWSVDNAGNQETHHSVQVKIDKTPPTINHTQSPAANNAGWNNAAVTVTFVCSDALSGVASCTSPQTVTTEGQNQLVTGVASDNAGNRAQDPATVSIDMTPPTISAAADRAANSNGWYKADVTVTFTCADALSGVTGCAGPQTLHEGANQSATGSATDAAGNSASTASASINIDETAPSLGGAPAGSPNTNGWYNADVTVHWTCGDALSGIDGACPSDATIHSEGSALTSVASVSDKAGNSTTATSSPAVNIDRTPPSIAGSRAPGANANGWNNGDVTVTFACADALSGVAACTGPQTVSQEGQNQSVTGNASDKADNSASTTVAGINIDKTAPTISAAADRVANANGWYNADVIVSFTCADALSGIAACPQPVTLAEGTNQSASGTASDMSGNSSSAGVDGINVDKTAPALSGAPTTSPNANGWYNDNVTVHWTASDALSGLATAVPSDATIAGEGDNLSAGASIADKADNLTTATVSGIRIDRSAPHTAASVPDPLPSGWYAAPVQVTLSSVDSLSGVAATYYSVDNGAAQTYAGPFSHNLKGVHTLTFWSMDKAGNVEDNSAASNTITLKLDNIAPSTGAITTPTNANSAGWFNAVTVTLNAADAESGVEHTYYQVDGGTPQL
jgi:hypothetical protein